MQSDSPPEDLRRLAALAQDAIREAAQPGAPEEARKAERDALADLREAVFPALPEPEEAFRAAIRAAIPKAAKAPDPEAARAILRAAIPGPTFAALRKVKGNLPAPLLRFPETEGAVLTAGEAMILSGEGGKGKSTLALQWALAAAVPTGSASSDFAPVAGVEVRRGPVVLASYEDDPPVVRERALRLLDEPDPEAIPEALTLAGMRGFPLFGPPPERALYNAEPEPLPTWGRFWPEVRTRIEAGRKQCDGPGLLILDPASCTFTGEDVRVTAVRRFLDHVRGEAAKIGCGVLIVAHPSKAGAALHGRGSSAVAGSPAWTDGARGVCYFGRREDGEPGVPAFTLRVEKVNYGALPDSPLILRREGGGPFRVEEPQERADREAQEEEAKAAQSGKRKRRGRGGKDTATDNGEGADDDELDW